jgi:hypothetical protein
VGALIDQASAAGLSPRLWALDAVVPEFEPLTIGSGPGGRSDLMNRMFGEKEMTGRWIVVVDDDIEFRVGNLARLLAIGDAGGLELFQPAHDASSVASSRFVRRVPGAIGRRTSFVEIGPCVVIRDSASAELLPFQKGGMGWGEDFRWARVVESTGIVAGIVDAVRIRHLGLIGSGYDLALAMEQARVTLHQLNFADFDSERRTLDTWRVWERSPQWQREGPLR